MVCGREFIVCAKTWAFLFLSRRPIARLIGGSDGKSDEKSGSGRTCSLQCQTLVRRSEVILDCQCEIWVDGRAVGPKRSEENNPSKFHPIEQPTADPLILF